MDGRLLALCAALATTPIAARAQRPVVHVTVADSADHPLADAEVDIVNPSARVVAEARTDDAGHAQLSLPADTGRYALTARHIGYAAVTRALRQPFASTVTLRLIATPHELAAVKVTAAESQKHKRLFVDADAIAHSTRPINDGTDVITKLRPDMVFGLGGSSYCQQPIQNLWINGQWIQPFSVSTDAVAVARASGTIMRRNGSWRQGGSVPDYIISALAEIHPEHIAEMSYHDCADMSLGRIHGENALFIVLKVGIAFDPRRGTYALTAADSLNAILKQAARPKAENAEHQRILGVFDAVTGTPVDSCVVIDSATDTRALTTTTGTISLAYLAAGLNTLQLAKAGYAPTSVHVDITPDDSVPVTVVLWPARPGAPR